MLPKVKTGACEVHFVDTVQQAEVKITAAELERQEAEAERRPAEWRG